MKAKTFENLIRKVVREEIDYALRREIKTLKEDLRDELKPTIVEYTEKETNVPQKSSLKEKIMGKQPIKQRAKQTFSQDNTLNDLLNETAQGSTNLNSGNAPVSLSQPFATGAPLPMDTTGMPSSVADAVTRNYSGLMKAIDKKKGL
tara:strand:- start:503 stop:943 length:441 start_codon:yes stop_codon:yes gene_type:complete